MDGDINLSAVPLSSLKYESRNLLCTLLNTKKVLPSDGPSKLPRDWRGLAYLVNITLEIAANISEYQDKTAHVLELWIQKKDGTATVGQLLNFLQQIDRYDIYDDLIELLQKGELIDNRNQVRVFNQISKLEDTRDDLITFDDVRFGSPQLYHAYVLFAREDQDFIDELLSRMRAEGFKLCTEDDLLPGHSTQYAPVSRLISERCHRIILVYSPEFLSSPANSFYMNHAQAVGIEMKKPKIIPCMYRECQLPTHLTFYHKLYYSPPGQKAAYDFWQRLSQSLQLVNLPRLMNSTNSTQSALNITELSADGINGYAKNIEQTGFLALPSAPVKSISMNGLDSLQTQKIYPDDSMSLSNVSETSSGKKKTGPLRKLINTLKGKKHKKAVMVEN